MRKLALALSLAVFAIAALPARLMAQAKPGPSYAVQYDWSTKDLVTAYNLPIASTQSHVFGTKWNIDTFAPLGLSTNSDAITVPTFGLIGAVRFTVSDESLVWLGLGARVQSAEKPHGYLFLGVGKRF